MLRSMGILLSGPDWVFGCHTLSGHWGVVAELPYCSLVSSSCYRTFMIETDKSVLSQVDTARSFPLVRSVILARQWLAATQSVK